MFFLLKYFKRFLVLLSLLITLIVISGVVFTIVYKDEIASLAWKELNKNLKTKLTVDEMSFSVFRRFPNASVRFKNLTALSANDFRKKDITETKADTLFNFHNVFLEFNILEIIQGNYKVRNVRVNGGFAKILTDKKGHANYDIFRSNKKGETSAFRLSFVKYIDTYVWYIDKTQSTVTRAYIKTLGMRGDYAANDFVMYLTTAVKIYEFSIGGVKYLENKDFVLLTDLNVRGNRYLVRKGVLSLLGMKLDITGFYRSGTMADMNINLRANKIDIPQLIDLLPTDFTKDIRAFETRGLLTLNLSIKGYMSAYRNPHVAASFDIIDGSISRSGSDVELRNLSLRGLYSNGKQNSSSTSKLALRGIKAQLGSSFLYGELLMKNFTYPVLNFKGKVKLNLMELQDFFKPDTIDEMQGLLYADLSLACSLSSIENFNKETLTKLNLISNVRLRDINIKIKGDVPDVSHMSGKLNINNEIVTDSLYLESMGSNFLFAGSIERMFDYLSGESKSFVIDGKLRSHYFDLNAFLDDKVTDDPFQFLDYVIARLDCKIDDLRYLKLKASNASGEIRLTPEGMMFSGIELKSMGGIFSGDVVFRNYNSLLRLNGDIHFTTVDVNKFFSSFDNFGMTFIQAKHLKGLADGDVKMNMYFDTKFNFIQDSLVAQSTVVINKGELINFEPLLGMSRFISVDELKHIRFSQLKNTISIRNRIILIPEMNIHSTAMNISCSGQQDFDNNFEYHVRVLMSDVLWGKAKKNRKESIEFGVPEDDGVRTSLYLTIIGNPDNYKVYYDKLKVFEVVKQNLKNERSDLKQILKEEYGWFKKDSTFKNYKEPNETDYKHRIKWVDDEEIDSATTDNTIKKNVGTNTKSEEDKLSIKWEDE